MFIKANKEVVDKYIAKSEKLVIVKFWAEWCGPCRVLGPILDEIAKESDADFLSVNADDNNDLVQQFGVRGIPTTLFAYKGQVQHVMVGAHGKAEIQEQMITALTK